jgi:hypothetical protein
MTSLVTLVATVGAAAALATAPIEAAAPVASFGKLPAGWHAFASAGAVATSWPYEPGTGRGGWADRMPKGGIAVSVTFPSARVRFEPLRLVLPSRPSVMLEGTRDTPEYRIQGRIRGTNVLVYVDIRSAHPTGAELRTAQRVLAAIRFS